MPTEFQQEVWQELREIPRGEVRTYAQIAAAIGKPKAARAVANACAANPDVPNTPCHRVVRSDGGLGGYSGEGGVARKRELLIQEGVSFL
jgi:methylated-DNA-[protein]-cysteine S-methyltransferase